MRDEKEIEAKISNLTSEVERFRIMQNDMKNLGDKDFEQHYARKQVCLQKQLDLLKWVLEK